MEIFAIFCAVILLFVALEYKFNLTVKRILIETEIHKTDLQIEIESLRARIELLERSKTSVIQTSNKTVTWN